MKLSDMDKDGRERWSKWFYFFLGLLIGGIFGVTMTSLLAIGQVHLVH
jgi:hypothetical protein